MDEKDKKYDYFEHISISEDNQTITLEFEKSSKILVIKPD